MCLKASYHSFTALYVTANGPAKESAPTDRGAFHKLSGSLLDYFPFLAAFLSAFFIFFAIMISFSRLLLKNSLWRDCGTPAIPFLAPLLRMSNVSVKKNRDYFAPGLVAKAIYCGTPP